MADQKTRAMKSANDSIISWYLMLIAFILTYNSECIWKETKIGLKMLLLCTVFPLRYFFSCLPKLALWDAQNNHVGRWEISYPSQLRWLGFYFWPPINLLLANTEYSMGIEKYSHELSRLEVLSKRMEVLLSGEGIWIFKSNNHIPRSHSRGYA